MGTKKTHVNFGGGEFWPVAPRIRDESASSRRKRRSLDLRPPAAPSSHTPLVKSTPPLINSSKHVRPHFLQKLSHNLLVHTTNVCLGDRRITGQCT